VATEPSRRDHLVAHRDRITEAINLAAAGGPPPFKLDVAVPLGALEELLAVARLAADRDGCRLIAFGHLAEGNLHLNHLGVQDAASLGDTVLQAVADLGGTISAEHGIGVAKTRWLHLVRSPGDLHAQAAIRAALDPTGMLNPGVLDAGARSAQVP
jgi:FAD/FMN-containing dehydrogenase